jgi:flagellar protein FliJ
MMAKKGFGLQQVLNYRQEMEKARKIEFAAAKNELETAAGQLQQEEEKSRQLTAELTGKQAAGMLAYELQLYADFSRKQRDQIKRQRETVDHLDQKMTEKREELLSAAKEKKVLETYKDKQVKAHRLALAEKERLLLDEIAVQNSSRDKR